MIRSLLTLAQEAPKAAATTEPKEPPATLENIQEIFVKPQDTAERVLEQIGNWMMQKGPGVLLAMFLLLIAWIIASWVRRLVLKSLLAAKVDLTLSKFFANISRWAILIFAFVTCLGTLGINTTSIAALVGAAGLAVGLALQGNLGNLASGILLLIFRPFKIGDAVIVAGQTGIVDGIDLFTTNLDTADNRRIIVPNGAIFSGVIENQTRHETRCATVTVPISIAAKISDTEQILLAAAERVAGSVQGALQTPAPKAVLAELSPTLTWTVSVWAKTGQFGAVRQALMREVKSSIDAAGIAPTPPVMQLRMAEGSVPSKG